MNDFYKITKVEVLEKDANYAVLKISGINTIRWAGMKADHNFSDTIKMPLSENVENYTMKFLNSRNVVFKCDVKNLL